MQKNINSSDYWNKRFGAGDWGSKGALPNHDVCRNADPIIECAE